MSLAGNLPLTEVAEVERLARQAWPGLEIERVDGWLLRHAAGITRRANSVWPNEAGGDLDLATKLTRVEDFYHTRNLPARFQICPAAEPAGLDARLHERGYRAVARTAVQTTTMAALLANLGPGSGLSVEVTAQPSARWWTCYAAADEVSAESVAARQAICREIKLATAYAMVLHEGEVMAVGSATTGDGWVGFFNIATLPAYRRMGAGGDGRAGAMGAASGGDARLSASDGGQRGSLASVCEIGLYNGLLLPLSGRGARLGDWSDC